MFLFWQERIRHLLDTMVEEVNDHKTSKEASSNKRKRDEELTAAGLEHRDNVARAMIGGEDIAIGGDPAFLSPSGFVERRSLSSSPIGSDSKNAEIRRGGSQSKKTKVVNQLLESGGARSKLEAERLSFEMEKFGETRTTRSARRTTAEA